MSPTATLPKTSDTMEEGAFAVLDNIVDIDTALSPRCARTHQTLREHDEASMRHQMRRCNHGRKELAKKRRGKPELSEAQNRILFSGHPSVTAKDFASYKLTRRQRAQVKILRKQDAKNRAGAPLVAVPS